MNAQQVVGMASINQDQIGAMPIPLMDSLEQEEIVEVIEHHFSIADKIEEVVDTTLKQSTRLRQSILKRAFEGRLVHQDPNDEPAEKLIERISKPTMKVNNHK
jgi:type I restriction enzyme S subunit